MYCDTNKNMFPSLVCGEGVSTVLTDKKPRAEVAYLELDTKELDKPRVKLDFSAVVDRVVILLGEPLNVNLLVNFELIRENSYGRRVVLNEWNFRLDLNRESDMPVIEESANGGSFMFTYCDRVVCPDCYVYKVEAYASELEEVAQLSVLTPQFNALVTSYL